jgi:hypothetical protein
MSTMTTLERTGIHNLSKIELQEEVDKRLNAIISGTIKGEHLEALKEEASKMAKVLLRRN